MITVAYITCRENPIWEWFFDSLLIQKPEGKVSQIIIVDYFFRKRRLPTSLCDYLKKIGIDIWHFAPLASPIQGDYKVTAIPWFDAALARNSAAIACKNEYIAFLDDLSILSPGWLDAVMEHEVNKEVAMGSYRKDEKMKVQNGLLISSNPIGFDSRLQYAKSDVSPGYGSWFYGCNLSMPIETLLQVNGYDEICAMVGCEDSQAGIRIERTGIKMIFDKRMFTIESAEHHFGDNQYFKRESFPCTKERYFEKLREFGINDEPDRPDNTFDIPWFHNDLLRYNPDRILSYRTNYNLRDLRNKVLEGGKVSRHDMNFDDKFWWTGEPLSNY